MITLTSFIYFLKKILSAPLERAKTKVQTKVPEVSPGFLHLNHLKYYINQIISKEGLSSLYYGIKASLDRQFVFNVGRFYGYYFVRYSIEVMVYLTNKYRPWSISVIIRNMRLIIMK